ncbi:MAG: sugar phosphate isomerase/epimerase [Clostridiaceae bacterium]|nr:sugar phosphate isomerase/epimerase [Clostridiaceae bacterium]
MYKYSLLAGEATGNSLSEKIEFAMKCGIYDIELQNNFLKLDIAQPALINQYRNLLITTGARLLVYEAGSELDQRTATEIFFAQAMQLSIKMVKIHPDQLTEDSLDYIEKVAAVYGIDIVIENKVDELARSSDLEAVLSKYDSFGLIVNPQEYAALRRHPFFNEFYKSKLKSKVRIIRVADAYFADRSPAMPGKGDAEIKELTSMMLSRSYDGYFSFIVKDKDDLDSVMKSMEMFRHLLIEM